MVQITRTGTPGNISLLFLPPYSPERNPMDNVFEFLNFSEMLL